jgi:hypothetical protein
VHSITFNYDRVFNNGVIDVAETVEYIQRLSWRWFVNNTAKGLCLLYEWVWNPDECMLRRGSDVYAACLNRFVFCL